MPLRTIFIKTKSKVCDCEIEFEMKIHNFVDILNNLFIDNINSIAIIFFSHCAALGKANCTLIRFQFYNNKTLKQLNKIFFLGRVENDVS